jgi:O-antigen/teichoic acid export membrane protein
MAGGLAVTGLAGYGFVALAGHTLPAADAATLASFYLMVNTIGPGLFAALEQETSRAISARRSSGGDVRVVVRRTAILASGLALAVLALLAAVSPILTGTALAGRWGLLSAVLLSVPTSAAVYLVRGLLGGVRRFSGYALTLVGEGLLRLLPCLALVGLHVPNATGYALVFAAGSAFGAVAALPWLRHYPQPTVSTPELSTVAAADPVGRMAAATLLLAGATVLTLLVANLAPIVVTARLRTDPNTAAAFASTFVLVRFPVLLFAPVQAMLLPDLTSAATRGDRTGIRGRTRLALLAVAAVGTIAIGLSATIGPWAVQILFGAHVRLPAGTTALLGVGTVGVLVAQVLQPALVALRRHRVATTCWAVGSVVLVGTLALPGDPVTVAAWGQVLGCAVVATGMCTAVTGAVRNTAVTKGSRHGEFRPTDRR